MVASVDFRMGTAHVENLKLTGDAYFGAGNGVNNTITCTDGANLLDGGHGIDQLVGGLGDDIYLIRHQYDHAVEWAGGGVDTVKSFLSVYQPWYDIENIHLQTVIT